MQTRTGQLPRPVGKPRTAPARCQSRGDDDEGAAPDEEQRSRPAAGRSRPAKGAPQRARRALQAATTRAPRSGSAIGAPAHRTGSCRPHRTGPCHPRGGRRVPAEPHRSRQKHLSGRRAAASAAAPRRPLLPGAAAGSLPSGRPRGSGRGTGAGGGARGAPAPAGGSAGAGAAAAPAGTEHARGAGHAAIGSAEPEWDGAAGSRSMGAAPWELMPTLLPPRTPRPARIQLPPGTPAGRAESSPEPRAARSRA